jgi:hypothetical protein
MKSWRTTTFGILSILYGLWVAKVTYVATNTLPFNLCYVWPGAIALILVGIGLIHARDHKFKDKE